MADSRTPEQEAERRSVSGIVEVHLLGFHLAVVYNPHLQSKNRGGGGKAGRAEGENFSETPAEKKGKACVVSAQSSHEAISCTTANATGGSGHIAPGRHPTPAGHAQPSSDDRNAKGAQTNVKLKDTPKRWKRARRVSPERSTPTTCTLRGKKVIPRNSETCTRQVRRQSNEKNLAARKRERTEHPHQTETHP